NGGGDRVNRLVKSAGGCAHTTFANLTEEVLDLSHRSRGVRMAYSATDLVLDQIATHRARQPCTENLPGGGAEQRHDLANTGSDRDRTSGLLHTYDCGAAVGPDRERHGESELGADLGHSRISYPH